MSEQNLANIAELSVAGNLETASRDDKAQSAASGSLLVRERGEVDGFRYELFALNRERFGRKIREFYFGRPSA